LTTSGPRSRCGSRDGNSRAPKERGPVAISLRRLEYLNKEEANAADAEFASASQALKQPAEEKKTKRAVVAEVGTAAKIVDYLAQAATFLAAV
jgi:hypothetical protein